MSLPPVRHRILQGLWLLLVLTCLLPGAGRAQGVELATLQTSREEGALTLEFAVRLTLSKAVEEVMQRGVPIYFVAQAELKRSRWYWRDERVARLTRSWRVAYQPLTSTWRVSLGALYQTHASLPEALAAASRSAGWRLAELSQLDSDGRYYVEFSYKLDTAQLPGPMQFGLIGHGDWVVAVDRVLRVE